MSLSKSVLNFPCEWWNEYKSWVVKANHSNVLTSLETFGRLMSYLIASRVKRSPIMSEFLYSAVNIIVLINDQILLNASCKAKSEDPSFPAILEKSRMFLTILEYMQVFLEITATKLWGLKGKWVALSFIQTIKFLWRVPILLYSRSGLPCRPIPPLNRKDLKLKASHGDRTFAAPDYGFNGRSGETSASFTLQSGRVIRKLDGAPPVANRDWKLPEVQELHCLKKSKLEGYALIGEGMHIFRPLCHLALVWKCGSESWTPWLTALGMDLASLKILCSEPMNTEEKKEIQRRQLTLLMYLLRSPFYDRFGSRIIFPLLANFSQLPLIGVLPQHVLQYLPYWQQLYSYTWD